MRERENEGVVTLSTENVEAVLGIIGVDKTFIKRLTGVNAVSPARAGSAGKPYGWGPEDIVKAFALKIESDKYAKKYPRSFRSTGRDIEYLRKRISSWKMGGYKSFITLPEWEKVTKEAKKFGMDFGKTPFAFQPNHR